MAFPQGPCWKLAARCLLLAALFAVAAPVMAQAVDEGGPIQRSPDVVRPKAITNDSVIRMVKAELDESIILQTIRTQLPKYDLSPEGLIALKGAGVSPEIISAMQSRESGLAVRPIDAKAAAAAAPGNAMPDEIGAYYKDRNGEWQPLRTERVVFRSSGWFKSAATRGIMKQDMNGRMEGPNSTLKLQPGVEILIYTPSGTEGEEYAFLRLRDFKDHREFRTLTGGILHSESGSGRDELDFTAKRVAPRTYTFTVPKETMKGEYGLLPPGSANQRGFADTGKIYTFSIPE